MRSRRENGLGAKPRATPGRHRRGPRRFHGGRRGRPHVNPGALQPLLLLAALLALAVYRFL